MTGSRPAPVLSIVVPCYDEQDVLRATAATLLSTLDTLVAHGEAAASSAVYFVDDGSRDRTWAVVSELCAANTRSHGIKLSRNYGHQNALLAGLLTVPGDAIISIDADLQDDATVMREMLAAYAAGAEIVYGVRRQRQSDSWFKRRSGELYYRLARLMGVRLVYNHADFRLMSRRAVETLGEYRERNVFLRGIIPQLGFESAVVQYDRGARAAGESKYPLWKMLKFAAEGITSFSAVPLKLITSLGLLVSLASCATAVWALSIRLFSRSAVPGWASTVVPLYFLGGVQLLCTGIVGQYLAKTYIETKARPRFTIEKVI